MNMNMTHYNSSVISGISSLIYPTLGNNRLMFLECDLYCLNGVALVVHVSQELDKLWPAKQWKPPWKPNASLLLDRHDHIQCHPD